MKHLEPVRRLTKKNLAPILIASFFAAATIGGVVHSGEHSESVDDFDGSVNRTYVVTDDEIVEQKALFVLRDYDKRAGTVFLIVQPMNGATSCDKHYLRLKTADGTIHNIDAEERQLKICVARIPAAWVKGEFTVRIPMFSGSAVTATFDTSTLDLERIAKK